MPRKLRVEVSCSGQFAEIDWLENGLELKAEGGPQCSQEKNKRLFVDTKCLNDTSPIFIGAHLQRLQSSALFKFPINCPVKEEIGQKEEFISTVSIVHSKVDDNLHIQLRISNESILHSNSLFPAKCQIFDGNSRKKPTVQLSDERFCPISSDILISPMFTEGYDRLFDVVVPLYLAEYSTPYLQCNFVPCGPACFTDCDFRESRSFTHFLSVIAELPSATVTRCSLSTERVNDRFIYPFHLKFLNRYRRPLSLSNISIIHPMNSFKKPPTKERFSVILEEMKRKMEVRDYCSENGAHIDENIMNSLPDPPGISIKELMELNKMITPRAPPRISSIKKEPSHSPVSPLSEYSILSELTDLTINGGNKTK